MPVDNALLSQMLDAHGEASQGTSSDAPEQAQQPQQPGVDQDLLDQMTAAHQSAQPNPGSSDPVENMAAGLDQGFYGTEAAAAIRPELVKDTPNEPDLSDRVVNHPAYYGGYVLGKLTQLGWLTNLGSMVPAAVAGATGAAGTGGIVGSALVDGAANAVASKFDGADNSQALQTAIETSLLSGGMRAVFGGLKTSHPGVDLSSRSVAEGSEAAAETAPKTADEYFQAIKDGNITSATSVMDIAKGTLKGLTKATQAAMQLKNPFSSSIWGLGMKAAKLGQAGLDALAPQGADEAEALNQILSSGRGGLSDGMLAENAISARAENIGNQTGMQMAKGAGIFTDKANSLFSDYANFLKKAVSSETELNPRIDQFLKLSKYVADQTGNVVDPSYVLRQLDQYVQAGLKNIDAIPLPTVDAVTMRMAQSSPEAQGVLMEGILDHQREVIQQGAKFLREFNGHPLVQALKGLGEASGSDKDVLLKIIGHAEDLASEMGNSETHASSLMKAVAEIRNMPMTSPAARTALAKAERMSIEAFRNGNAEGASNILDRALGLTKAIHGFMSKGYQSSNEIRNIITPAAGAAATANPDPNANLAAIASYNQSRGQANAAGARNAASTMVAPTPAQAITSPTLGKGRRH